MDKKLIEYAENKYGHHYGAIDSINGFLDGVKYMQEEMFNKQDMIKFAEYVTSYPDKNRNHKSEILHAKSKYDGAERTIDLLKIWLKEYKTK